MIIDYYQDDCYDDIGEYYDEVEDNLILLIDQFMIMMMIIMMID